MDGLANNSCTSVRRCLFGPPDTAWLSEQMTKIIEQEQEKAGKYGINLTTPVEVVDEHNGQISAEEDESEETESTNEVNENIVQDMALLKVNEDTADSPSDNTHEESLVTISLDFS